LTTERTSHLLHYSDKPQIPLASTRHDMTRYPANALWILAHDDFLCSASRRVEHVERHVKHVEVRWRLSSCYVLPPQDRTSHTRSCRVKRNFA